MKGHGNGFPTAAFPACKRAAFATQKGSFCNAKGQLSEANRRPFGKRSRSVPFERAEPHADKQPCLIVQKQKADAFISHAKVRKSNLNGAQFPNFNAAAADKYGCGRALPGFHRLADDEIMDCFAMSTSRRRRRNGRRSGDERGAHGPTHNNQTQGKSASPLC